MRPWAERTWQDNHKTNAGSAPKNSSDNCSREQRNRIPSTEINMNRKGHEIIHRPKCCTTKTRIHIAGQENKNDGATGKCANICCCKYTLYTIEGERTARLNAQCQKSIEIECKDRTHSHILHWDLQHNSTDTGYTGLHWDVQCNSVRMLLSQRLKESHLLWGPGPRSSP